MTQTTSPQKVWVLNVLTDVDDYKRRGRSPQSIVYLTNTLEAALCQLVDVLHEKMGDLYGNQVDQIDPQLLPYLQINTGEYDDAYEIKDEYHHDQDALSFIHSIISEGEFVPFTWNYTLSQQQILN